MKLWGGRFTKEEDKLMEVFNSSLEEDLALVEEDIAGSIAHAEMLVHCKILSQKEGEKILQGLHNIKQDIESGKLTVEGEHEDIHSFVEATLTEMIGEAGKKLHTSRSRNDQVATDLKLYAKKQALETIRALQSLNDSLEKTAAANRQIIMPGYTHLQRAQVVTFGYHLRAYIEMFKRDIKRLEHTMENLNESPLGSGALAGTTHTIDRQITAEKLGFRKPTVNFMDGVSDRDFIIELLSDFSMIMMHLSRLSEELILWSSQEFSFIKIDDAYATGSSIMPQKKNPDAAELIRGKTGKVYGALVAVLTTMKGLPLAYNKDMQEVKLPMFQAVDEVLLSVQMMDKMVTTLQVNGEQMKQAIKAGFLNATEVADYLVQKGVPFRDAHGIVGAIVLYCEEAGKSIEQLTLEELQKFSDSMEEDIFDYVEYTNLLKRGNKQEMLSK
ncbi:argininosuccinate lyase [Virgibacillus pantothenticus]|uniref:Argininosuccinate lyase n=1 Tax=Virgibacillus pantothenticus TaxID=1473 RepID=A0A0L0QM37_VIRPA|nr:MULTISPECIES: argininosuccinate lyase [Virgibacillus]API91591.1 argininosuccinate lyase [Virgibacillus sp. 6R]KNE19338.1 argininosuccinate lyase [Virgibacillus pantothenticus]MBS7426888.1 argininosuccinate lyase [Virgibacillus sp. 19R1-5]MED3738283.1 argininosuccinate lyase [Virgibacillus pantothenticus]QTY15820.1 argininosuccinate lyase [Virgibacillus pantothenticus]